MFILQLMRMQRIRIIKINLGMASSNSSNGQIFFFKNRFQNLARKGLLGISIFSLILSITFCMSSHAAGWQRIAELNVARSQFVASILDDKIVVFGGIDEQGTILNSIEILNLKDPKAWSIVNDAHGIAIRGATGVGVENQFYVLGGYDSSAQLLDSLNVYSAVDDRWRHLHPMPNRRYAASAISVGGEILVFGGHDYDGGKTRYLKTIDAYTPQTDSWRTVGKIPGALEAMALAKVNDTIYAFGGLQSGNKARNTSMSYNPATQKWLQSGLTPVPYKRLFAFEQSAPVLNGKIYLIGGAALNGSTISATNSVAIYDPASNTWQSGPALPQPLLRHVAVATENALYVIGGTMNQDSVASNQVYKLKESWLSWLSAEQTCDLNADGKFTNQDALLFHHACQAHQAYWHCDLNDDNTFNAKDVALYKTQWKNAKSTCPERIIESGQLSLSSHALDLGTLEVGVSSGLKTIQVSNTGKNSLDILSIDTIDPQAFVINHDCPSVLDAAKSCRIQISFTPITATTVKGTITVNSDESTQTITLHGTGRLPSPEASLSSSSLDFGDVALGSTSLTKTVQLTNSGKVTLDIHKISTNSGAFITSSTCGDNLSIAQSCSVSCEFRPTSTGITNASLSIDTNAPNSPHIVYIRGTGFSLEDAILGQAFANHLSNLQVQGTGMVTKILADDLIGDRHQRFILRLNSNQTLLIAHNIDIAPRLGALKVGDTVSFYGEYEWNNEGGVIHWTHHDPAGSHIGGWLKLNGATYQ